MGVWPLSSPHAQKKRRRARAFLPLHSSTITQCEQLLLALLSALGSPTPHNRHHEHHRSIPPAPPEHRDHEANVDLDFLPPQRRQRPRHRGNHRDQEREEATLQRIQAKARSRLHAKGPTLDRVLTKRRHVDAAVGSASKNVASRKQCEVAQHNGQITAGQLAGRNCLKAMHERSAWTGRPLLVAFDPTSCMAMFYPLLVIRHRSFGSKTWSLAGFLDIGGLTPEVTLISSYCLLSPAASLLDDWFSC